MEILITANSPGEIAGWTSPVVRCIKSISPEIKVTVLLLPCSFSSGREMEVAKSIRGIDRVLPVKKTLSLIFRTNRDAFDKDAVLLHLGGDLFYAAILSHRLKIPVWAYEWGQKQWDRMFSGYFARDDENKKTLIKRGIPAEKIHVVGDPIVDSVYFRSDEAGEMEKDGKRMIGIMPGSRTREALGLIPLFCGVAELIEEKFPGTLFYLPISPFIDRDKLESSFPLSPDEKIPGTIVRKEGNRFITEKGVEIAVADDSMKVIKHSDFIITIPGTTTAEAGALGIPHISIMPLNRPELIPYIGIIGLLEHVPLVGKPIKARIMKAFSRKKPLLSQPNLRAKREVIPEMMEVVNPENIFEYIKPYIEDSERLNKISDDLLSLYLPYRGAAEKMAEMLVNR